MARIGVVGIGSIGSVLARGFHRLGHQIRINDVDAEAIASVPFSAASKAVLAEWADVVVVAVPTPTPSVERGGDPAAVEDALVELTRVDAEPTIVLRSTMPPGSTRRLADEYDVGDRLVYSPEFLRDRSTVEDFFTPDRIVLAGPEHARATIRSLMDVDAVECDTVIELEEYITAELGKYAHNALFATKVSFANQMRLLSERAGADAATVMEIVTADSRNTTSHLDPLLGPFGGSCLPKDLAALRAFGKRENVPTPLLDATKRVNDIANDEYEYLDISGQWPHVSVSGS